MTIDFSPSITGPLHSSPWQWLEGRAMPLWFVPHDASLPRQILRSISMSQLPRTKWSNDSCLAMQYIFHLDAKFRCYFIQSSTLHYCIIRSGSTLDRFDIHGAGRLLRPVSAFAQDCRSTKPAVVGPGLYSANSWFRIANSLNLSVIHHTITDKIPAWRR